MASPQFNIKENDTTPALKVALRDARNRVRPLTGATVVFHMRLASDLVVKITGGSVGVQDASLGIVSYTFSASDTDTAGIYEAEFQVTYSDGTIETFPNDDYIKVIVVDDVA